MQAFLIVTTERANKINGFAIGNCECNCHWFILQVPCIIMVEEVDATNLYIAVSSPNLNFNITRDLDVGHMVNSQERFYSVSMPVELQVCLKFPSVYRGKGVVRK